MLGSVTSSVKGHIYYSAVVKVKVKIISNDLA